MILCSLVILFQLEIISCFKLKAPRSAGTGQHLSKTLNIGVSSVLLSHMSTLYSCPGVGLIADGRTLCSCPGVGLIADGSTLYSCPGVGMIADGRTLYSCPGVGMIADGRTLYS